MPGISLQLKTAIRAVETLSEGLQSQSHETANAISELLAGSTSGVTERWEEYQRLTEAFDRISYQLTGVTAALDCMHTVAEDAPDPRW